MGQILSPDNKFKTMGVMNVTPNSFSDGGVLAKTASAIARFKSFCSDFDIIDIGAESTAPFNAAIGAGEELSRLESFFYPLFDSVDDPAITLSIDTYRPEVFYEVALWIRSQWPKCSLIFNDVSGKVDADLLGLLKEDFSFSYVLSHNLCPTRDRAGDHMQFAMPERGADACVQSVAAYLQDTLSMIGETGKRIVLDPCFGFSKTREQNQDLLRSFSTLESLLPKQSEILVGISRKSFLRFPADMNPKLAANQEKLDLLQVLILQNILREAADRKFIFRAHSPNVFEAIAQFNRL